MNSVTVIIPVYSNTLFINECVNSVKESAKGYDCQILIGVDGCEVTERHIKQNKEVFSGCEVYVFNRNIGCYSVRNNLLSIAKHESIVFFDSDDIMGVDLIKTCLDELVKSDLVVFDFEQFENGKPKLEYGKDAHGCFACKKHLFELYGYYESWICGADTEFRHRLESYNIKPTHIEKALFKRRMHRKNLTRSPKYGFGTAQREYYRQTIESRLKSGVFTKPVIEHSIYKRID